MQAQTADEGPELRKFVAPEFVFGVGARHLAGRAASNLSARCVLVVTDPGVVAAGWTDQVVESLHASDVHTEVYAGVTPNPRVDEVMAGAEAYARERCNALVAVGGGSPIDCAKGIGIVSATGRHIGEFEGVDTIRVPPPPLLCVPTTAGSSADVSQFAILTDIQRRVKFSIISKALVPDLSLIDPETLTTLPADVTALTGVDALTHALEAFVSNASSPITDLHALAAIREIVPTLKEAVARPDDIGLRSRTMLGSLQAGLAFSNTGLGLVHAMAHSLGGLTDLAHGAANAALLAPAIRFNYPFAEERYGRIAEAMGLDLQGMAGADRRDALVEKVVQFLRDLGITQRLGGLGVDQAGIRLLAKHASRDPSLVTNPRPATRREIEVLYEEAF